MFKLPARCSSSEMAMIFMFRVSRNSMNITWR
jgi:hypothetical protein